MLRLTTCMVLGLILVAVPVGALAQSEPVRIGVFDPEIVWRETEVGKKYNQDLSKIRDRLQAGIDGKQEDLEALRATLRQQQASLNDEKIQQMQMDILNKKTELERMNEDATKEMKFQLGDVQTRFQDMLIKTLDTFGKEKGFSLILNMGVIDYHAPSVDITRDLIAKFNEMHPVSSASAARGPGSQGSP
jgi:Skp family chaperone for outer membrane proteins